MATREEIIQRIRKALGRPSDGRSVISESALLPGLPLVGILPTIPPEELLSKFEAELTKVAGMAHRAANRQGLEEILKTILSQAKTNNVVLSRNPLLAELSLEPLVPSVGEGRLRLADFWGRGCSCCRGCFPEGLCRGQLCGNGGDHGCGICAGGNRQPGGYQLDGRRPTGIAGPACARSFVPAEPVSGDHSMKSWKGFPWQARPRKLHRAVRLFSSRGRAAPPISNRSSSAASTARARSTQSWWKLSAFRNCRFSIADFRLLLSAIPKPSKLFAQGSAARVAG